MNPIDSAFVIGILFGASALAFSMTPKYSSDPQDIGVNVATLLAMALLLYIFTIIQPA